MLGHFLQELFAARPYLKVKLDKLTHLFLSGDSLVLLHKILTEFVLNIDLVWLTVVNQCLV